MTKAKESKALVHGSIAFSPALCKSFGVCAGLLIQQIHYWCMDRAHLIGGHFWVYNTTKEWADQLGVFDERTIKNNLKALREQGIVIVGNHNKHKYDKTLWYRLDYEALAVRMRQCSLRWLEFHDPLGNCFTNHSEAVAQPIPETTAKTTSETPLATAAPSQDFTTGEGNLELGEATMAKGPSTASQLLSHLKEKQGTPVPAKENSASSLERVFKTVAPKHNEMSCIPSFTMKDKGQLGRLAKSWGSEADKVMETLCSDWAGFSKDLIATLGMSKRPLVPHLPFIVKYADHAMAYHRATVQLTAKPAQTIEPVSGPVSEQAESLTVNPPKKKLVIIKKKAPEAVPAVSQAHTEPVAEAEDEMSLEALLALGNQIKN